MQVEAKTHLFLYKDILGVLRDKGFSLQTVSYYDHNTRLYKLQFVIKLGNSLSGESFTGLWGLVTKPMIAEPRD